MRHYLLALLDRLERNVGRISIEGVCKFVTIVRKQAQGPAAVDTSVCESFISSLGQTRDALRQDVIDLRSWESRPEPDTVTDLVPCDHHKDMSIQPRARSVDSSLR
jgi:hypothetical protein